MYEFITVGADLDMPYGKSAIHLHIHTNKALYIHRGFQLAGGSDGLFWKGTSLLSRWPLKEMNLEALNSKVFSVVGDILERENLILRGKHMKLGGEKKVSISLKWKENIEIDKYKREYEKYKRE